MPFASIRSAAFRTLIIGVTEMTFLVMMSFANIVNLLARPPASLRVQRR
jgi:hypothetical protein